MNNRTCGLRCWCKHGKGKEDPDIPACENPYHFSVVVETREDNVRMSESEESDVEEKDTEINYCTCSGTSNICLEGCPCVAKEKKCNVFCKCFGKKTKAQTCKNLYARAEKLEI